ncbi:MAG: hypothetical protein H8E57_03340 [Candidatus Cloacimonetes bacterium]|nr:hypothetical protein [Candidatus Cloacimonadota bacterium]
MSILLLFTLGWSLEKTASGSANHQGTIPVVNKTECRPVFPEGVVPQRISQLRAPINENTNTTRSRDGLGIAWEDDFEADADLFYYEDVAYIWYCPDEFDSYAVRFTPFHGGTLDGAWFYFYGGDATAINVHVWDDDGSDYPNTLLGSLTGYAPALAGWEYIDLSSLGITTTGGEDFFISFEVNGAGSVWVISSSGGNSTGVNRSLVWTGAAWEYAIDNAYCGFDYEWCIDAMITYNDPWAGQIGKWQFNTDPAIRDTAHSPTHCWWVDEEITGGFKDYLISPEFTFASGYNVYNLSLWVDIEFMRSKAGATSIDEYYEVYIADKDAVVTDWWHTDTREAYAGTYSWWCGDDGVGWPGGWGYGDSWNQWIQTPELSLPLTRALYLDFMHRYDSEPAYDFCYVEITTDNWVSYDILASYDGTSNTWAAVQIDIGAYAGEDVSVRFRFESDGAYSDEDGDYFSEGAWFIDNVSINDGARTTYFEDNADDEVNFLVNEGNFDWVRLFYDYDRDYPAASNGWEITDQTTIFNGTTDVTSYADHTVQLKIAAQVDDSTYAQGAGLYIDDIVITAISLPEFDTQCDFLVVPYPQTEGLADAICDPKMIYHQAGYGTSGANGSCDVLGTGLAYPLYDFRQANMGDLAMGEYGISDLTLQLPQYVRAEGTFDFVGWCDGADAGRADSFAPDTISVDVFASGEYELGYNSRLIGNYYYPACTGAVTYYTPFTDGYFTTRDTYYINGINHMLYSRGLDYGTEDCLTFQVYEAATPTTFGALLYEEEICFASTAEERFNYLKIPFASAVEVTGDFFIHMTGDFINYPGGAPHTAGYFVYSVLVDSEVMFEDELGAAVYAGHNFNYNPTRYTLEEEDRGFYINALINYDIQLGTPENITIVESGGTVTLSWDPVRFATSYSVYSDTNPYGSFTTLEQSGIIPTTWNEAGSAGMKFYRVTAN